VVRKYDPEYINFTFIIAGSDGKLRLYVLPIFHVMFFSHLFGKVVLSILFLLVTFLLDFVTSGAKLRVLFIGIGNTALGFSVGYFF